MKVLVLSHLFPHEQNQTKGTFVSEQVRALSKVCEVRVVCPVQWSPPVGWPKKYAGYRSVPREDTDQGTTVYFPRYLSVPRWRSLLSLTVPRAVKKLLAEVAGEFPFDLIHAHTLFPDAYAASLIADHFKVPFVFTVHGSDVLTVPARSRYVRHVSRKTIPASRRIIAVSRALIKPLEALGAKNYQLSVIPNGVDQTKFSPLNAQSCRTELHIASDQVVLVCVANLVPVKGLDVLIGSLPEIERAAPGVSLFIIGDGPMRSALETLAQKIGMADRVHLIGARPHSEIRVWLNAANLVVQPSLSEGQGVAIIEAMSCGKAVVASHVGGIPDLIDRDDVGYTVEPGDSEKLAGAIVKALNRRWSSQVISERAKQYSIETTTAQIVSVYEESVKSPRI